MHCPSCGKQMGGIRIRCPECRAFTPAFWLNIFSLLLLVVIVAMNYVYLATLLPVWQKVLRDFGMILSGPAAWPRMLVRDVVRGWLPVLVLPFVVLLALRWKKVAVLTVLKSGKLLAAVTLLALVGSAVVQLGAFAHAMRWMPEIVSWLGEAAHRSNEYSAIESIRRLNAAQASYRQKHPGVGFTCNLKDLQPHATFAKTENQAQMNRLFEGSKDLYRFWLHGCERKPSSSYQIRAEPFFQPAFAPAYRAFCSDESGTLYFSDDGRAATCLTRRTPLY